MTFPDPNYKPRHERKAKACQSCGLNITNSANGRRWTLCSFCYWKQKVENLTPLEELYSQQTTAKEKHKKFSNDIEFVKNEIEKRSKLLKKSKPLWKKILGIEHTDIVFLDLRSRSKELNHEASELEREMGRIQSNINHSKIVKKRFADECKTRELRLKRQLGDESKRKLFRSNCFDEIEQEYQRNKFRIRNKDYKRGNLLDNYFRNKIPQKIFDLFNNACVYCNGRDSLTLDHYAIPKNEGGNFILLLKETGTLKSNLVVLCHSCNSMKGECHYSEFFSVKTVAAIKNYHRTFIDYILNDPECLKTIKKWYEVIEFKK